MSTGFYWDERCFWHSGGSYALTLPVGGLVQPLAAGGLPESPETKRRLRNLMDVTGLSRDLVMTSAEPAGREDMMRIHPESYLDRFKEMSDAGGGELGLRTPFGKDGYEIAALSAGLARQALLDVMRGRVQNAYSLSRPPGHHCLPDWPNGFCLLNNIAIAIAAAQAEGLAGRVAVVDWDVHHGNGTEHIFYDRDDVLTISVHQEHNYPLDAGDVSDRGTGTGEGCNMNIPLPPGAGHVAYLEVMDRLILPALERFRPDVIVVACGYDAGLFDPLARMLCTADTFGVMTARVKGAADRLCDGRLLMVHEGGYSEAYVPFCGHRVLEELSGSSCIAPDPVASTAHARQPNGRSDAFFSGLIGGMEAYFFE
ncbi:deacetylase / probable acetylpolyamine aminohydrolase [Pseudooceanicola batsensis HTCC2597]|uniref:Deacetylase / probable acetylpolyamine aminohydrolase n=1 Tax=Pseudooceanicola batsensis (strain ATCC BAA-863 / DSM 15984 / KCTC 12145 / HTCC2597) TaxID=252305 RepID=A3TTD8_PSEBH|nr:class II histone deacetylase [Pseudooceanicola batsensis]EAQ04915.1 deacetylase / probable acetylpolyamine aminohydrolase [Pseudooceanicola batsensis HTCC2597]